MGKNSAETALLAIGSGLNSLGSILLAGWTDFQPESSDGELFLHFSSLIASYYVIFVIRKLAVCATVNNSS